MFEEFAGKIVLVTGASTGIGAAVARKFGALGARVGVHYNAGKEAAETVARDIQTAGGEAFLVKGDMEEVTDAESVVNVTTEHFGGLDILINNAGALLGRVPLQELTLEQYDRVMNLNARSVIWTSKAAIKIFHERGRGNIIMTGSIAGRTGGAAGSGLYASSKAFVSSITRALAKEQAPHNIRVNAVSPGVFLTPFHERDTTAAQLEAARVTIPMQRLGDPEECVGAYLFLASEELSSYVTGQIIEVNGGQLMP